MQTQTNNYCVYRHTTPNGKVYIGITKQELHKRWKNGKGYELCTAFFRAIKKYGWENITHEVLYSNLTEAEACDIEVAEIAKHKSADPRYGYNLTNGGEHYTPNEEWRRRSSEAHRKYYEEHPEIKAKISQEQIGRKASDATREKMSASRNAYLSANPSAAYVCGNSFRGKKRSVENCEKLRIANMQPIKCVETGVIYPSIIDAAAAVGVRRTSISNNLTGRSKTAGGHRFEYLTEEATE